MPVVLRTAQTNTVLRHNGVRAVIGQRPPAVLGGGGDVAAHAANPVGHGVHVHTQVAPATVWTINHFFGWQTPHVILIDDLGIEFMSDIDYVNANTLTVTMAAPTAGTAYLTP